MTIKITKTMSFRACKRFCHIINKTYGHAYLQKPTRADVYTILKKAYERGFPSMLKSLDCMHWEWKHYPNAYHGAYTGHHGRPTIILEAVASYDTWISQANFGTP
ncbi:hypothetical protein ACE6H2_006365 [Prunus campanulata]